MSLSLFVSPVVLLLLGISFLYLAYKFIDGGNEYVSMGLAATGVVLIVNAVFSVIIILSLWFALKDVL